MYIYVQFLFLDSECYREFFVLFVTVTFIITFIDQLLLLYFVVLLLYNIYIMSNHQNKYKMSI